MKLIATGFQQVMSDIAEMGAHARTAAREALLAVGRRLRKDLKVAAGKTAPLSRMTYALKAVRKRGLAVMTKEAIRAAVKSARPTRPWGSSEWTVKVPRNLLRLTVSTRGANKLMEYGGRVTVSERMQRFLHLLGFHLRGDSYWVKPRPVFGPVFAAKKEAMFAEFRDELFRRIGARMSRWRIG